MFSFATKPSAIPTPVIVGIGTILFTAGALCFIILIYGKLTADQALTADSSLPDSHTEDITPTATSGFYSMYGTVDTVSESEIQITVSGSEGTTVHHFAFSAETEMLQLSFANDDDTTGEYRVITIADLHAGDNVAVYTEAKADAGDTVPLIKIIKLK